MPFTLTMPKLSPTMEMGTITKWCKKEGDFIEAGDVLMEVATDKATVEHQALDEGYLRQIIAVEGSEAYVNQAIAVFTEDAKESLEGYKPEGAEAPSVEADPAETDGEESAAVPSGKATLATKSAGAHSMQQPAFIPEAPLESYSFPFPNGEGGGTAVIASPLAKRQASDKGLDLSTVKGSGPNGRVMSRDLEKAQVNSAVTFGRREHPTRKPGEYREEKLTPMRQAISKRLQEAKTFIPHFYTTQRINVDKLMDIRTQLKHTDVKVSFNDFVVRASALALRQHPVINSGFNTVNNTLVYYETIDISIAVSMDGGLITPIVRHADYKNVGQLSMEIKDLAKKARDGKLEPHEYRGGSFTVSNLGMYGISEFSAIINPPQAAILAVGGIEKVPVVQGNRIVPGNVMTVTLSADHRVIDGSAAAEFLRTMKGFLENPASLII